MGGGADKQTIIVWMGWQTNNYCLTQFQCLQQNFADIKLFKYSETLYCILFYFILIIDCKSINFCKLFNFINCIEFTTLISLPTNFCSPNTHAHFVAQTSMRMHIQVIITTMSE